MNKAKQVVEKFEHLFKKPKAKASGILIFAWISILFSYQNCAQQVKFQSALPSGSNSTFSVQTGLLNITAAHPNPPLDIFFIVDNSGSMLENQNNLSAAFQNIFSSNTASLSNFDVNVYLFSTDSTLNPLNATEFGWVPIQGAPPSLLAPLTNSSSPTDISNFAQIPGNVFANWNSVGTSVSQLIPVPVFGFNVAGTQAQSITPFLHIPAQGSTSQADYQTNVQNLTALFQSRLANLDPTYTENFQSTTDVSSGLCTMAKILRHASDQNFISPGHSGVFVMLSDDNERLDDRNSDNNQCLEAVTQGSDILAGSCGNYSTTVSYNYSVPSSTASYPSGGSPNTASQFSFSVPQSTIAYSAPTENCTIQSQTTAYNYNLNYTPATTYTYALNYTPAQTYAYNLNYTPAPNYTYTLNYTPAQTYAYNLNYTPAPNYSYTLTYTPTPNYSYTLNFTPAPTYSYALTYTPPPTYSYDLVYTTSTLLNVTYYPCNNYDGICASTLEHQSAPQSVTVPGAYSGPGCPANINSLLPSTPDTNKPIVCTVVSSTTGSKTGVSTSSSQCTSSVLALTPSTATFKSCTITPVPQAQQVATAPTTAATQCSSSILALAGSGTVNSCVITAHPQAQQTTTASTTAATQCSAAILALAGTGTVNSCVINAQPQAQKVLTASTTAATQCSAAILALAGTGTVDSCVVNAQPQAAKVATGVSTSSSQCTSSVLGIAGTGTVNSCVVTPVTHAPVVATAATTAATQCSPAILALAGTGTVNSCVVNAQAQAAKVATGVSTSSSQCTSTVLGIAGTGTVNSCVVTPVAHAAVVANGTTTSSTQCLPAVLALAGTGTVNSCVVTPVTHAAIVATGATTSSTQCSPTVLALAGTGTVNSCVVTPTTTNPSVSLSNQAVGVCENYCATHPTLTSCQVTSTTTGVPSTPPAKTILGNVACSTACSASNGYCSSSGTVQQYLQSTYGPNTSCTSTASSQAATISITSGTAACSDTLGSTETISDHNGSLLPPTLPTVCTSGTLEQCIDSLTGTSNSCSGATVARSGFKAPSQQTVNLSTTCETLCSAAGNVCPTFNGTVSQYYGSLSGSCVDGAAQTSTAQFSIPSANSTETCESLCTDSLNGFGCGTSAHPYGAAGSATAGKTIGDYIASLGGTACSTTTPKSVTLNGVVTPQLSADPNAQAAVIASVCTDPTNPVFFPTGQPAPGQPVYNYTAGDVNHNVADFKTYIQTQAQQIYGANNMPAVAVITHLKTDTQLVGTNVATDYIDLATNYMNSASLVSSITGNYAPALSNITNFVVTAAQNSFVLPMPAGSTMMSAQVMHQGATTWETLDADQWSLVGQTLSFNSNASLQVGDQIMYTYRSN